MASSSVPIISAGDSLTTSQTLIRTALEALDGTKSGDAQPSIFRNGSIYFDTDIDALLINLGTDTSRDVAGLGVVYTRKTVAFGDFSETVNGTAEAITLLSLPADSIVVFVRAKTATAFSGGGIATLDVTIGDSGDADRYLSSYDLTAASADSNTGKSSPFDYKDAGAFDVLATFTPDGASNLDAITAGSVEFIIGYSVLKK